MANENKNQEFNKAIKQLQSMANDKAMINLAEKFFNLKNEMLTFMRGLKEKETKLVLDSVKQNEKNEATVKEESTPSQTEISASQEGTTQALSKSASSSEPASPVVSASQNQAQNRAQTTQTMRPNNGYAANQNQRYQSQSNSGYNKGYSNNNRYQGQGSGQSARYQNNQGYGSRYNQNQQGQGFNRGFNNQNQRQPFNRNGKDGFARPYGAAGQNGAFNRNGTRTGGAAGNTRAPFNRDSRPPINYAQPVITASPNKNFGTKRKDTERHEEKRSYSRYDLLKRGIIDEENIEDRMVNRRIRPKKKENVVNVVEKHQGPAVITTDNITVKLLSEVSGKPVSEIIKKFMLLGMMVTINSKIDYESAELILSEMGVELVQKLDKTSEEKLKDIQDNIRSYDEKDSQTRPPIVTVMGHVDHGKTSLLDYIRKTKVTLNEAGGITQAIGAYMVNVGDKAITFIDTPGHEAFTAMRARGAQVTDIAILIVAADDGIMPQTVEAISHIKSANIPMIVAINKMDKPNADPDRVMQQLAEHNVLPEAWGGDAIICKISAHTGEGIDKLLETILLVADMQGLKANPSVPAIGTILESRLDKGRGAIASLIVLDGSLHIGDTIISGTSICKVKAMMDENNRSVKVATPSMPVTVLGFSEVPAAGETFTAVDEKLSKQIVEDRRAKQKEELLKNTGGNTLEDLMQKTSEKDVKVLNVILKTDVNGSLEAIRSSIMKLVNEEVKINILHSGVGAVSESDLILANASNAMVIAFNVGQDSKVKALADRMKIKIYSYKIIYELLDEIERVVKGMKEPKYEEVYLGKAEILAIFKLSTAGSVAGSRVIDGRIVRGEHAKLYRGDDLIAETEIKSLKIVKDDVKEAGKDRECGIKLGVEDYQVGDTIVCYSLKRIEE